MTVPAGLAERRVLVVGASAGIGRATAVALSGAGAHVGACARRAALLVDLEAATAGRCVPIVADVTVDGAAVDLVDQVVRRLGGLDAVIYTAAATHLEAIERTGRETWEHMFTTNVIAFSEVMAAALGPLRRGWGRALAVTSDSVGHPFPGLSAYVASKAALESAVLSWQAEHPELDIVLATVGPTATDAAASWDPDALVEHLTQWQEGGFVRPDLIPASPEEVADELVRLLAAEPFESRVDLAPPRPWV